MKTYTFDENLVSDLHKDAYGFRPDQSFWGYFASANADQKQAVWDNLLEAADRAMEREAQETAAAIQKFEMLLTQLRNMGAKDFSMVLSWLHQAHDTDGDDEFLEFRLGLPFGYLKRSKDQANGI